MPVRGDWSWIGSSVRGPRHRVDGTANQDAWRVCCRSRFFAAVVCDGLGSRTHSSYGARAACRALIVAAQSWSRAHGASTEALLRLIHAQWTVELGQRAREECATTCLFALFTADGRGLLGQLGDGLVYLRRHTGGAVVVSRSTSSEFTNETTGLGIATNLSAWSTTELPTLSLGDCLMMATDGVSEDLIEDRRDAFLDHAEVRYPPKSRDSGRVLARDLRKWPVVRHTDDKTILFVWHGATGAHV